ncbi:hypothetical protein NEUTE1DRAFT_104390 [Neurospora tetrasperma FGSC 2508]|uniref:Uncharacterized protein n=1 Tax=Neurospora tetrasperma (strain FGSC 2508 / ATCC MYA-4615 / P0657) TaxID=510951 RepID=F8MYD1_NEUT8|nr:uncharacterized protein NEUTE1DRAFT_104390 [Neurospora tetrasperma FGSC 2508]EGO51328.1 hypothetical protein NEUTE1DRAFT_104390 [Neurospora tetrasperma FGSC 2508]
MVVQAPMLQEPSLVPRVRGNVGMSVKDGPNPGKMMIFNTSRFLVLIWQEIGAAAVSRKVVASRERNDQAIVVVEPLMTDGALFTRRGLPRSSRNQLFLLRAAPEISKRNADDAKPMGLWLYGPTRASFGSPGTRKICPEPQPPQRH